MLQQLTNMIIMRYIAIILVLGLLAWCTWIPEHDQDIHIQNLETEIQKLKTENANLRVENDLLKQWWLPPESQVSDLWWMFWDDTTFTEWSNAWCIREAEIVFLSAGNTECSRLWYTDTDIQEGKCKLWSEFIQKIQKQKEQSINQCNP